MSASTPTPSASPTPPSVTSPPPTTSSPPPTNSSSPPPPPTTATPPSSTSPPPPPRTTATPPSSSPPSAPTPSSPDTPSTPSVSTPPPPPPPSSTPTTPSSSNTPSRSSPPPPPKSPSKSSPPPPPSSGNSSNVSVPVIAAVSAVAAIAVIVLLYCLVKCCCKKKRKRQPYVPEPYYGDRPPKDNYYGGTPQQWQHNAPPPVDHVVKVPPSPSPPPVAPHRSSSGANLPPPPPPPPPPFSSGETSSSGYSGKQLLPPPSPPLHLGLSKTMFSYEELELATNGFSRSNLLGQGGFGSVFKGILPGGQTVAVKQLKVGGSQGEREFQAEVEIISRVHHRHLVSLVGYCIAGSQRLLVYEFVANDTLEHHLHGKGQPTMDWPTRMKIALGSARGLAYLHEDCYPRIIHRDIKSSNILLDSNFEAKVADFGLAKLASDNFTHVSTRVMGTFGYLAPEYASSGKLTDRSDVFSYGVVLLELITSRRPVDTTPSFSEDSLVDWARPLLSRALEDGNVDDLVDPRLRSYDTNEMMRLVSCAASCVRHSARRRPRMGQIVRGLEGDVSFNDLNEGVKPGHSSAFSAFGSSDYDSSQYSEDMKKFRKMALNSQEYGSEYSHPTSEYGLNPSVSSGEYQESKEMDFSTGKSRASRPTSHRRNYSSGIGQQNVAGKGKYAPEDI